MDFDLKEVFSILDENHEGQIQLRRFVDVANNYYSDAEVSTHQQQQQLFRKRKKDQSEFSLFIQREEEKKRERTIFVIYENDRLSKVRCIRVLSHIYLLRTQM